MFFRYQQTSNLLTVDDAYAKLVGTSFFFGGSYYFNFSFKVNIGQAINHGAHTVGIKVLSRYVPPPLLLGNTHRGIVDTFALVENIRLQLLHAKQALQQRDKYIVGQSNVNLLSYVNNEIMQQLRTQVPAKEIHQLNLPRLQTILAVEAKRSANTQPILTRLVNSYIVPDLQTTLTSSAAANPQHLMQDMIARQGLDPSHILNLTPRAQSEVATRGGLSNTQRAIERPTDPASQLLNFHLFPSTHNVPPKTTDELIDEELVQVIQTVTETTSEIDTTVVIPFGKLRLEGADLTHLFVQFDLINSETNQAVDTVVKTLNVTKELQVFHTPKLPPIVKAAITPNGSRATVQVKQIDPGATSVQIYKKTLYAASADQEDYSLVGNYSLSRYNEALQIQVDVPHSSATMYRVIPVGTQNAQGFEFSSVVVKPSRYTPLRAIALTGVQIDQGIQLEARNIPVKCVAIQFLKYNLTTHDSTYTTVNGDVGFVDDAARAADLVTTIDSDVFDGNVYRYVARLIMENGITEDFGDVTMEFVRPAPGQVDTSITDFVVQHDTAPDVSFVINTVTTETDMDAIKKMLEHQNIKDFFQGDIANQREQLTQLIAHTVQRVDLKTGVRENFGTVTSPNFSDSALRKTQAVSPLQYGHSYRYEIYPLLRAPETMFEAFTKTSTDKVTKKPYTWKPFKFLHPLAIGRHGVIVSATGAGQRYAKDPMSFGVVGAVTTVEASFDNDTAKIVKQTVTRFNRSLNIITWQVQGDINQVDHFLIMKQVHGIRHAIGKAHSEFPYGSCQYIHPVTHHDNGGISYVIVPVMIDYKVGPSATTNTVIVDAP
jgi:hypothetical protein